MHEIDRDALRAPTKIIDLDLAETYGDQSVAVAEFQSGWCLIRNGGVGVGTAALDFDGDDQVSLATLQELFTKFGDLDTADRETDGRRGTLTVAICTRGDQVESLQRTLQSLAAQSDSKFDVVIVDNSATGVLSRESFEFPGLSVRVVHAPIAGLSRARNRAIDAAVTDYLAFIDDDEVADPDWVAWLKTGFAQTCRPQAVSGVILPGELQTEAQVNIERYGGIYKGRGMLPQVLKAGTPTVIDPLFPLPGFGAGGNMAFTIDALRAIGGFDNRLGAGTLTCGGEETLALSLILDSGGTVLHWPPASVWHYSRPGDDALVRQFYGYSAGLTAYYMSLLLRSPKYFFRILGFMPTGIRRILGQREAAPPDFPVHLLQAGRSGLLSGAWLYLREAVKQRRMG